MSKMFKSMDDGEPFVNPEKPFLLVYESENDGISVAWLETEQDMVDVINEVKSYGCSIMYAIEVESCRDFIYKEI